MLRLSTLLVASLGCTAQVCPPPRRAPEAAAARRPADRPPPAPPAVERLDTDRYRLHLGRLPDTRPSRLRTVASYKGGELVGLRVQGLHPGDLLWSLGVRNRDVLRRVDGLPVNSATRLETLARALERPCLTRIELDRRGVTRELRIEVVP